MSNASALSLQDSVPAQYRSSSHASSSLPAASSSVGALNRSASALPVDDALVLGLAPASTASGTMHDLSNIASRRIEDLMSHQQWCGDADDVFVKRLVRMAKEEAVAAMAIYHNDSRTNLAARIGDLTVARLKSLCKHVGLIVPAAIAKDAILARQAIQDFVEAHASKHPHLVRTPVAPSASGTRDEGAQEGSGDDVEEEEEEEEEEEDGDEPSTPPTSGKHTRVSAAIRASPRANKGIRTFAPPALSASTVHRRLDVGPSKSKSSGLSESILGALGNLPDRPESSSRASEDGRRSSSKVKEDKKAKSSKERDKQTRRSRASSASESTDSDSDGPASGGSRRSKGKKQHARRSSSPLPRCHRELSADSGEDEERPTLIFKTSRHSFDDDTDGDISSILLTQPLAPSFLKNVYRSSGGYDRSVRKAYEQIEFNHYRNQRECLSIARVIDLLESKQYKEAREVAVRRLIGVHTADTKHNWDFADVYELEMSKRSFVPDDFAASAAKAVSRMSTSDRDSKSKSKGNTNQRRQQQQQQRRDRSTSREPPAKSPSTKTKSDEGKKRSGGSRK
jgi:ribosomal protein L12E/L44/L45/RPP1/RPP2